MQWYHQIMFERELIIAKFIISCRYSCEKLKFDLCGGIIISCELFYGVSLRRHHVKMHDK